MKEERKHGFVELTDEMLDTVTGGTIFYMGEGRPAGEKYIVVRKRKDDGITEMFYTDDYQEAIRYAESMGASTELIDLSCWENRQYLQINPKTSARLSVSGFYYHSPVRG